MIFEHLAENSHLQLEKSKIKSNSAELQRNNSTFEADYLDPTEPSDSDSSIEPNKKLKKRQKKKKNKAANEQQDSEAKWQLSKYY